MINPDLHDSTRVRIEAAKTDKRYANVISVILTISHSWMPHHKCDPFMFSESVIAFVNLINVILIVKVLTKSPQRNFYNRRSCSHIHGSGTINNSLKNGKAKIPNTSCF